MSEYIVKIIPQNEKTTFDKSLSANMISCIDSNIKADSIELVTYDEISFIDCGGNLEEIRCPHCNKTLPFDIWGDAMEKAAANGFSDLNIKLPCCGSESSLNDLYYNFPCGFAKCLIQIINPDTELSEAFTDRLEELSGYKLRIIHAHY